MKKSWRPDEGSQSPRYPAGMLMKAIPVAGVSGASSLGGAGGMLSTGARGNPVSSKWDVPSASAYMRR